MKVRTYTELQKELAKRVKPVMEQYAQVIKEEWTEYIEIEWYQKYTPKQYYPRLYAYAKSLYITNIEQKGRHLEIKICSDDAVFEALHPKKYAKSWSVEIRSLIDEWGDHYNDSGGDREGIQSTAYLEGIIKRDFANYLRKNLKGLHIAVK